MSQLDRLFLEDVCPTLRQRLEQKLLDDKEVQEQDFQDFEVSYRISAQGETLKLAIKYPFLQVALRHGAQALLERVWEGLPLQLGVEPGVLELSVDVVALGADRAARERCVQLLASVRMWLLIGPLVERLRWLRDAAGGSGGAPVSVPAPLMLSVRRLEACWIVAKADRLVVIFTVHLDDEVEVSLGRTFCQEFADTNKKPTDFSLPCTFAEPKEPPSDLKGVALPFVPNVGFLSLTLSDQMVLGASEERLHALARPVMGFRNFFNFHLKNAKSYLHSRMRKRLDGWEQNLKGARRAPRRGQEKRRLASGKEFVPGAQHPERRQVES